MATDGRKECACKISATVRWQQQGGRRNPGKEAQGYGATGVEVTVRARLGRWCRGNGGEDGLRVHFVRDVVGIEVKTVAWVILYRWCGGTCGECAVCVCDFCDGAWSLRWITRRAIDERRILQQKKSR